MRTNEFQKLSIRRITSLGMAAFKRFGASSCFLFSTFICQIFIDPVLNIVLSMSLYVKNVYLFFHFFCITKYYWKVAVL